MRMSRGRRVLAGVAVVFAGTALAFAATPGLAFASPTAPGADMSVNVPGPKIGVKSTGKTVRIDITNRGPDPASHAKVVIQIADVADSVDVLLPGFAGCTDEPNKVTCPLGDLPADAHEASLPLTVTPSASATPGVVGKLTVTVSSNTDDPDPDNNTQTVQLELVAKNVDLVAMGSDLTLSPGQSGQVLYTVSNDGDADANPVAVDVAVRLPHYVTFA